MEARFSRVTAICLSWFLGPIGAERFYLGLIPSAAFKLFLTTLLILLFPSRKKQTGMDDIEAVLKSHSAVSKVKVVWANTKGSHSNDKLNVAYVMLFPSPYAPTHEVMRSELECLLLKRLPSDRIPRVVIMDKSLKSDPKENLEKDDLDPTLLSSIADSNDADKEWEVTDPPAAVCTFFNVFFMFCVAAVLAWWVTDVVLLFNGVLADRRGLTLI